ncbi:MAG: filamentous hemagglutinin N-terminal domain-containing protein [Phycisphaerales bacterium]|nr:filamentous hemagglutinin N-terminal domain-containing protein [Phycisphaerales bacterium]
MAQNASDRCRCEIDAFLRKVSRAGILILTASMVQAANADVVDPQVASGSVTITPVGNSWIIQQGSQTAIVNYSQFSIGQNQSVVFNQPNASARILNRVQGNFPTTINGQLTANGIVYIVNPAGVFIGPTGLVNVGQLYAAAGSMTDSDFLGGIDRFTGLSNAVENHGTILGSRVHLVGNSIVNTGTIDVGPGGVLAMVASTGEVTLSPNGPNTQVFVSIDQGSAPSSATGVENAGTLRAGTGGQIVLGAGDLYSVAIRNTASGVIDGAGATVQMQAKDGLGALGTIEHAGSLGAGELVVEGSSVTLDAGMSVDTAVIHGAVVIASDVVVSGHAGDATSVAFADAVNSAAGEANDLVVHAAETTFSGDVGKVPAGHLGTLAATGDVAIGGDVLTHDDILLGAAGGGSAVTFTGAGSQTLASTAGDVDLNASVSKAAGDLHLAASPMGQMRIEGATVHGGGSVFLAGDNVLFDGAGNQAVDAGQVLGISAKVAKPSGDLALEAGSALRLYGSTVSTDDGGLRLDAPLTLFGNNKIHQSAAAGSTLEATGSVQKTALNLTLEAGDTMLLRGVKTSADTGALTLRGPAIQFANDAIAQKAAAGTLLTIDGNATKAQKNLTLEGQAGVVLKGATTSATAGDLHLVGPSVSFAANNVAQAASASGQLVIDGTTVKPAGNLVLSGANLVVLGPAVTVNGTLAIVGPVQLVTDTVVNGTTAVTFDGTVDGGHALEIESLGDIRLVGSVGAGSALESLEVRSAAGIVTFSGSLVKAVEEILLNVNLAQTIAVPAIASIAADGDIVFECAEFKMGQNQKLTTAGDLKVLAGSATLGDLSALGDIAIDANTILLLTRERGQVLNADGSFSEDNGLDFVAGGKFAFKVAPIAVGGFGTPVFGSPVASADASGTLGAFAKVQIANAVLPAQIVGLQGQVLDLTPQAALAPPVPPVVPPRPPVVPGVPTLPTGGGSNDVAAATAAAQGLEFGDDDTRIAFPEIDEARSRQGFARIVPPALLGIRMPTEAECTAIAAGEAVLDDAPTAPALLGAANAAPYEAVIARVPARIMRRFVQSYDWLAAADRSGLDQALRQCGPQDLGAVASRLLVDGDGAALQQLVALERLVRSSETLGFNRAEEMRVYRGEVSETGPAPRSPLAATLQRRLFACDPQLAGTDFDAPAYRMAMKAWREGASR